MNKISFKIFSIFVLTAAVISTILLAMNFFGFAILGSDIDHGLTPQKRLAEISRSMVTNADGLSLEDKNLLPQGYWCMVIDPNGSVIWSEQLPENIPRQYTINTIAQMTRWYLNDHPVYVQTEDYGLLVLGLPPNSLGKYEIAYSMEWFNTLPQRILGILLFNLCLAAILAFIFGIQLYRRLKQMMNGIHHLNQEEQIQLKERGIFKDVFHSLNHASQMLTRKNTVLARRDSARSNWISGISHDIRTPLSVITGYADSLCNASELTVQNRQQAQIILNNSLKIKRLIEDLNLISSMEYDMQPSKKLPVKICPLLRSVVTDILNGCPSPEFQVHLHLYAEKAVIKGDENLLYRAIFNLIHNAIQHNEPDCIIEITAKIMQNQIQVIISDNGSGVPEGILSAIHEIPKTTHGIGLPMAYRIIQAHGGSLHAYNKNGFTAEIFLPLT